MAEATGGHVRSGSVRICSSARLASVRVAHVKTKGWLATQAPQRPRYPLSQLQAREPFRQAVQRSSDVASAARNRWCACGRFLAAAALRAYKGRIVNGQRNSGR